MRFSLQDVKKSVQRRGGSLGVTLHFLRAGELHDEISRLIAYHERLLGQPQRAFAMDEARAYVGEYRMANCLLATLSHWYNWRQREWNTVVSELGGNEELLQLASSTQLRLALYSYVNELHHGFLRAQQRDQILAEFASRYAVSAQDLDYLLVLDSEGEALLTREAASPPTAQDIATLYNQWAFEAALFNASSVHFVIDYMAFSRAESAQTSPLTPVAGIGAVIKRLCFLARRLGVYYDLEYEQAPESSLSGQTMSPLLNLTLYGPQEVTGAPQQYGLRLARLCRFLLGYGQNTTRKKPQLASGIVEAEARIHFLQRAYTFAMDARVLQLLPAVSEPQQGLAAVDPSLLFDSSIEQHFSEAFFSLARNHGVDGWQLEREQEPLLLDKGIFLPDFALSRGKRRIYFEILGFWTPAYRERKVQKLHYLRGRKDLVLAIPLEAKEAFSSIVADFPVVYYQSQLSVMDVLQVLQQQYDDFAERLAHLALPEIHQQVQELGFVPESQCYALLNCYRRSELQQAATRVCAHGTSDITFVAGLGMYHVRWLEQIQQHFQHWLEQKAGGRTVWSEALHELRRLDPALQTCEDATLETLVGQWSRISVQRASIFEVTVELLSPSGELIAPPELVEPAEVEQEPRKVVRERRSPAKKRTAASSEIVQGDLWG
ncbi:hypothetical protein KDW_12220 [Dictyobacter vulcani]|uniref:DUF790 domain-containing protein n=1 Tax=Dictyobacter vulcani TaxID=2607529 RepID=A0A5J4KKY2_9CHLR|nr:DUF790 family protein [Dictyobacter vulcani]GER87060.1 hypothetical protein KDW_12220 [Dictyobacter vulcani]